MANNGSDSGIVPAVDTAGVPKIKNPAGIPQNAMTEAEFLSLRGVGDAVSGAGVDMIGGANQFYLSSKQKQQLQASIYAQMDEYYAKREAAKAEYKALVAAGVIRDKTKIEKIITKAHGNPDNASTQAARNMAKKMGFDWKTGKKL